MIIESFISKCLASLNGKQDAIQFFPLRNKLIICDVSAAILRFVSSKPSNISATLVSQAKMADVQQPQVGHLGQQGRLKILDGAVWKDCSNCDRLSVLHKVAFKKELK